MKDRLHLEQQMVGVFAELAAMAVGTFGGTLQRWEVLKHPEVWDIDAAPRESKRSRRRGGSGSSTTTTLASPRTGEEGEGIVAESERWSRGSDEQEEGTTRLAVEEEDASSASVSLLEATAEEGEEDVVVDDGVSEQTSRYSLFKRFIRRKVSGAVRRRNEPRGGRWCGCWDRRPRWCRPCSRCVRRRMPSMKWFFGFGLTVVGDVFEASGLAFASQSTIVAIGHLGLPISTYIAHRVFGESIQVRFPPPRTSEEEGAPPDSFLRRVVRWDALNYVIIYVSVFLVMRYAPVVKSAKEANFTAEDLLKKWIQSPYLEFVVVLVAFLAFCFVRWAFFVQRRPLGVVLSALCLGTLQSLSITLTKIVTMLVRSKNILSPLATPLILVYVMLLVLQIYLENTNMGTYEQVTFGPINSTAGMLLSILGGVLFYWADETNFDGKLEFTASLLLLIYANVAVSRRKQLSPQEIRDRVFNANPPPPTPLSTSVSDEEDDDFFMLWGEGEEEAVGRGEVL